MRRTLAGLLAVALLLPGCASWREHLGDEAHPWHAWPALAGVVPGYLAVLPFFILEDAVSDSRNIGACPDPGPVGSVLVWVAGTPGFVLGGAFWIAGSPLELVVDTGEEGPPPRNEPAPDGGEGE